jgi:hypothetical protein
MLEKYGFFLIVLGAAIGAVGYLWLVIRAFQQRFLWGVAALIPPLPLLFIAAHWRKSIGPLLVCLLGGIVIAVPYGMSYYERLFPDLGPHEKMVGTELHITLTGWDRTDYSFLKGKPTTVVLQMANADVTDGTLEYLKGMDQLRELDLNDTQITDAGLSILADLPRLKELRLRKTKITDEGFQKHLAGKESLMKLDLTGTDVKGKTKRDWKKAKDGRDYLD